MGSRGNCEIVEEKYGPGKNRQTYHQARAQERDRKPPIIKKVLNKSLEDDINKLFEAVNLRNAKSLDLSDSRRNASKKPMRGNGSHSPVVGFSEPVSLKQALRGLCISQAADMAAMKRLSMTSASPRISESEKITSLFKSVVVEGAGAGGAAAEVTKESTSFSSRTSPLCREGSVMKSVPGSSCSSPGFRVKPVIKNIECISSESARPLYSGDIVETSLAGETSAFSTNKLPRLLQEPKIKPLNQNAPHSSPGNPVSVVIKDAEASLVHENIPPLSEVDTQLGVTLCSQNEKHDQGSSPTHQNSFDAVSYPNEKMPPSKKVASGVSEDSVTSSKVASKAAPKPRRKSKLHNAPSSSAVKTSKDTKSTRSTSRAVKPVIRNKNLLIKKSKKVTVSSGGISKASQEVNIGPGHSSAQVFCQRCQCSLLETDKVSSKDNQTTTGTEVSPDSRNCDPRKLESIPTFNENIGSPVVKKNMISKSSEKGDISQSSKSSICDFSSSTTSLSEDSNLSGSIGNRPHMSKDTRWKAINRIRKQYGFLGLSHFNLLKKLGSGDIGTVYLAELVESNCPFAIKVMDNEFLARRKKMVRAQTEREILRMLDHPFLPTLYAQFTSDNLSCLVMEYCPGGDLHVLRQKQPGRYFPEQAARFYVAEVLLALEYLHMLGIVYRDLKPENILVREDGHIMLTDFDLSLRCSVNPTLVKSSLSVIEPPRVSGPCAGSNCIDPFCSGPSCKLACFSPRLLPATARARKLKADAAAQARSLPQLVAEPTEARSNSFVGTHEYLAPEIIKGDGHGSAVDWWTFGVFLYELLYGKTPFKGAGNEETLANVVLQNLKFPDIPIVSFQARDLIRGLLMKEPENRLGTETGAAEIKRHPFFEGLNWALIRCAVPPQIPELFELGNSEKGRRFVDCNADGEHLEFELF